MAPRTLKIKSKLLRVAFKAQCGLTPLHISTLISCLLIRLLLHIRNPGFFPSLRYVKIAPTSWLQYLARKTLPIDVLLAESWLKSHLFQEGQHSYSYIIWFYCMRNSHHCLELFTYLLTPLSDSTPIMYLSSLTARTL